MNKLTKKMYDENELYSHKIKSLILGLIIGLIIGSMITVSIISLI